MARPIEATPVLRGRQAARFIKNLNAPKTSTKPVIDIQKLHSQVMEILKSDRNEQK